MARRKGGDGRDGGYIGVEHDGSLRGSSALRWRGRELVVPIESGDRSLIEPEYDWQYQRK